MISPALARSLVDAGLLWKPRPGDAFVLLDRDMDHEVFFLADMTVEVHHFVGGDVIGFNGTTEWALDSIELGEALWLPREDQLRDLLDDHFVALHRRGDGFELELDGSPAVTADSAEEAYALALLAVLLRRPVHLP